MKKFIACLVIVLSLVSVHSFAQDNGDRMARMKEMWKKQLKDSLQLDDTKADKVIAIQSEFMPQQRTIWMDQSLSEDDKKAKLKDLNDQMKTKLKTVLSDDEIAKYEAMQRNRMMRGGGRRGGGGGN